MILLVTLGFHQLDNTTEAVVSVTYVSARLRIYASFSTLIHFYHDFFT
jgi:hypothetical protein